MHRSCSFKTLQEWMVNRMFGEERDLEENLRIFVNCATTKGKRWNSADLPFYYDNKPWILQISQNCKLLPDKARYFAALIGDLAKAEQVESTLEENRRLLSVNDALNFQDWKEHVRV